MDSRRTRRVGRVAAQCTRSVYATPSRLVLAVLVFSVSAHGQAGGTRKRVPDSPPSTSAQGSLKVLTGLPASVVFLGRIRQGVTNASGELELPHVWAGSYPVRVRTPGFVDWHGRIVISHGASRELKVAQQPLHDQAMLHYQNADQLRDQGKNQEAVEEYQRALSLNPRLVDAHIGLARSLIALQQLDEAEPQLRAVLDSPRGRAPEEAVLAEARTVLANLLRYQGLGDDAIAAYHTALRLARGVSPEAHIGLAIALEEKGDLDGAVKEYRAGISQDMDTEAILYYLLGNALEKQQKDKEAVEAYSNYLRLDPQGQYASAVQSMIDRLKD